MAGSWRRGYDVRMKSNEDNPHAPPATVSEEPQREKLPLPLVSRIAIAIGGLSLAATFMLSVMSVKPSAEFGLKLVCGALQVLSIASIVAFGFSIRNVSSPKRACNTTPANNR
jgi:hypothetical protein